MEKQINILNRKATFEFAILQEFSAGMVLTGTEIKSIRSGKVNLTDGYCVIYNSEVYVKNIHIAEYENGNYNNHASKRDRKLLLNKSEIRKMETKLKDKGLTIIPLRMFINENGYAKLNIGIAKGKKIYDKREDIKKKDVQRDMDRGE